jgi:hypothetical protein
VIVNEGNERDRMRRRLTVLVILQSIFEIRQIPILVRPRNSPHALHLSQLRVLDRQFDQQQARHVLRLSNNRVTVSKQFLNSHNHRRNGGGGGGSSSRNDDSPNST